jgi:hypothetical protein
VYGSIVEPLPHLLHTCTLPASLRDTPSTPSASLALFHTHIHTSIYICTYTRQRAHAHAHARTHTPTPTHTHFLLLPRSLSHLELIRRQRRRGARTASTSRKHDARGDGKHPQHLPTSVPYTSVPYPKSQRMREHFAFPAYTQRETGRETGRQTDTHTHTHIQALGSGILLSPQRVLGFGFRV